MLIRAEVELLVVEQVIKIHQVPVVKCIHSTQIQVAILRVNEVAALQFLEGKVEQSVNHLMLSNRCSTLLMNRVWRACNNYRTLISQKNQLILLTIT